MFTIAGGIILAVIVLSVPLGLWLMLFGIAFVLGGLGIAGISITAALDGRAGLLGPVVLLVGVGVIWFGSWVFGKGADIEP